MMFGDELYLVISGVKLEAIAHKARLFNVVADVAFSPTLIK